MIQLGLGLLLVAYLPSREIHKQHFNFNRGTNGTKVRYLLREMENLILDETIKKKEMMKELAKSFM